jgi:deferrochelatase/peroxidase EfeB
VSERRISRRQLLGGLGAAGAAGIAVGGLVGVASAERSEATDVEANVVPFHGAHQAGIVTVRPSYLVFAAYDAIAEDRDDLRALFAAWTREAELLTQGDPVGPVDGDVLAPPGDNGEAIGLGPANLTVTFGVGPSLFERDGVDRYGLAARRPEPLAELPVFGGDALDPARSGGDLCVQACADDPQVAFHAVRTMTRTARGAAVIRWQQLGFLPTHARDPKATPRNLLGFHDGTNDIRLDDRAALREHVWVGSDDGPAWMRGGTYAVTRRIRMLIEVWDRSSLDDQQQTIGRFKVTGAPLTGAREFDPPDLGAIGPDGEPTIAADAHIRLASSAENGGARILRRSYSFSDGVDPRLGQLDAGLFFVAFQRDPRTGFVPIQQRLAQLDALNEYIKHVGSAVFAIPPGVEPGGTIAAPLFA